MSIALVTESGAFLGLGADFHKFVWSFLNAPAALRGQHAPEEIGRAAMRGFTFPGGPLTTRCRWSGSRRGRPEAANMREDRTDTADGISK